MHINGLLKHVDGYVCDLKFRKQRAFTWSSRDIIHDETKRKAKRMYYLEIKLMKENHSLIIYTNYAVVTYKCKIKKTNILLTVHFL